jgi:DNA-binding response OmpR family regulator
VTLSEAAVLIADANPVTAAARVQVLRSAGAGRVIHVPTLARGLQALPHAPCSIVLVDPAFGEEDGFELVRAIRRDMEAPFNQLPILAITNEARASRVAAARDAGVDAFLVWPMSVNGLTRRVEAVLNAPRAFVRSESFHGPDRRRGGGVAASGPVERRSAQPLLLERRLPVFRRHAA